MAGLTVRTALPALVRDGVRFAAAIGISIHAVCSARVHLPLSAWGDQTRRPRRIRKTVRSPVQPSAQKSLSGERFTFLTRIGSST